MKNIIGPARNFKPDSHKNNTENTMNAIIKTAAAYAATLAGLLLVSSCHSGNRISGTLEDMGNDSLAVFIYNANTDRLSSADTIAAENGKISVSYKDTAMTMVYIMPVNGEKKGEVLNFTMLPGERLRISGTLSDPVYSGTPIYDGLAGFPDHREIEKKFASLQEKAASLAGDDIIGRESVNAEFMELSARRDSIYAEYIRQNPNDLTSGYLTLFMNPEKGLESYNLLGPAVKESAMGRLLDDVASYFVSSIEKEKNKQNMQPGKPAPEFNLKGLDGKEYTLASFRGKYVLLDFWGKWCYWCMKGMPQMKEYYAKYKNRIEFVGIDCRDSEDTWRETVESEGLDWTNLYNGNGQEILVNYAVEGFPTKVLIDKEGKIVQVFVGESEELYEKLDRLF